MTTHVCLTARALGADGVIISDVGDRRLSETVERVVSKFGGHFAIETGKPWRRAIDDWRKVGGRVVHLTAYGLPMPRVIGNICSSGANILVVVGSEKVPAELFQVADWNVSVTSQPISEVSALGIFLDWFFNHSRLEWRFENAKLQIIPMERGKRVEEFQP